METKLTEAQSLTIITEMIEQTRNNIQKGTANSMIFWGYTVALVAVLNFILMYVLPIPEMAYAVWLLIIPCAIAGYFIQRRVDHSAIVRTHIDSIISGAWKAFGVSVVILLCVINWMAFSWQDVHLYALINPSVMLLVGISQFVTAVATRFKPFLYGAVILWIGAIAGACLQVSVPQTDYSLLVLAVCIVLAYVIPGHLLNKKAKEHV